MALFIIRYCLFVPKMTYVLRCSIMWKFNTLLKLLDNTIAETLGSILNCSFTERSWDQATLPVRFGGLGIRKISSVALPAFLSSVNGTNALFGNIISPSLGDVEALGLTEARDAWTLACPGEPLPIFLHSQKQWVDPLCRKVQQNLLDTAVSPVERARLLAVGEHEAGYWLQEMPSAAIGTLLDKSTFTMAACRSSDKRTTSLPMWSKRRPTRPPRPFMSSKRRPPIPPCKS